LSRPLARRGCDTLWCRRSGCRPVQRRGRFRSSMDRTMQQTRVRPIVIAGVLAGVCLAAACQGSNQSAPPSDDVWATVDGRQILREEVDKAYRTVVPASATPPPVEELLTLKLGI